MDFSHLEVKVKDTALQLYLHLLEQESRQIEHRHNPENPQSHIKTSSIIPKSSPNRKHTIYKHNQSLCRNDWATRLSPLVIDNTCSAM